MEWRRRLSLIEETYEVMRRRLRKYSFQSRGVFSKGVLSVKDSFDLEIKNRQAVTGMSSCRVWPLLCCGVWPVLASSQTCRLAGSVGSWRADCVDSEQTALTGALASQPLLPASLASCRADSLADVDVHVLKAQWMCMC